MPTHVPEITILNNGLRGKANYLQEWRGKRQIMLDLRESLQNMKRIKKLNNIDIKNMIIDLLKSVFSLKILILLLYGKYYDFIRHCYLFQ